MITFSRLKRLEQQTIQAIRTEGVFGRLGSLSLASAASRAQIIISPRAPIDVSLSFTLPTRLREDQGRRAIERPFHVGCIARGCSAGDGIASLSYSVLIGQDAHPCLRVARKFHFDFEPAIQRNPSEAKPTFHLQLCGELSVHQARAGYDEEHINHLLPAWSQPRIPMQPMSLALVLNWLFLEFGCEASVQEARMNPRWRSLVREAERDILKPYYMACSNFLSAAASEDESFFSKIIYEERG